MSTKRLGFTITGPRGGVVRGVKYGPNTLVEAPWELDGKPHTPCRPATSEELKMWRRLQRMAKNEEVTQLLRRGADNQEGGSDNESARRVDRQRVRYARLGVDSGGVADPRQDNPSLHGTRGRGDQEYAYGAAVGAVGGRRLLDASGVAMIATFMNRATTLAELHEGYTPWGEAPTRDVMMARLDAFLVRYADACADPDKATRVRTLAHPKLPGMYS